MNLRLRLIIHGNVQGVGFRLSLLRLAQELGLTGSALNSADGTVCCEVQGSPDTVDHFTTFCQRGPRGATVTDVATEPMALKKNEEEFVIA